MTSLLNYLIRQTLITSGSPPEKWKNKYTFPFILPRAGEEKWLVALSLPASFVLGVLLWLELPIAGFWDSK